MRQQALSDVLICACCYKHGKITPAIAVDHIRRHSGLDDPLAFDRDNLQSLCWSCHSAKTSMENATGQDYLEEFDFSDVVQTFGDLKNNKS